MSDVAESPNVSKSPLASTTFQALLVNFVVQVVGIYYPPVGDWLSTHQPEVLGALTTAIAYGRGKADKPLDWKNWTVKGVGIKF